MAASVALVTGASSGIGAALARRIAREGRDLVLSARNVERLQALARELTDVHGVRAHVVPADLSQLGGASALADELGRRGLEVEWLVNNAGFGTAGRFDRLPVQGELEEIRVNCRAPVELTGRLLPGMVQRRRGAVLNVASLAAFGATPYTSTYGATKAFLLSFSESLAVELEGTGVHVVCVCPGFTRTEFQERAHLDASFVPGFAWMSADAVADQAVRALGRSGVVVNGAINAAMSVVMRLSPRNLVARISAAPMRRLFDRPPA